MLTPWILGCSKLGTSATRSPSSATRIWISVSIVQSATLTAADYECIPANGEIPGVHRFHTHDPFGNRIEFQQT